MDTAANLDERRRSTWRSTLAFFDELARAGVRDVCISPGSRSTPLAVSAATVSRIRGGAALRTWIHLDERSAAFFALGVAKATGQPSVLVCTSGTAAANYLPAIVEARYAGVPLIALTADRPPELRDRGAGQTIQQNDLFGSNVRWFHEMAVPDVGGPEAGVARSLAARAVTEALGRPRGAVHLNWPFREPLDPPAGFMSLLDEDEAPAVVLSSSPREASSDAIEKLAEQVRVCERGVIACGPSDDGPDLFPAAAELARLSGWPLLAEPTSGTRGLDAPVIAHADLVLRDAAFASAHRPDCVVRIGRSPTSKAQRLWLESARPKLVLIDPDRAWNDPGALVTHWIEAEPASVCRAVCERVGHTATRKGAWLRDFQVADRAASEAITTVIGRDDRLLGPAVVRELAAGMPSDAWLYVSNSMAVRDVDAYWPLEERPRRVLSSRGASGIDGVTSSALGVAAATDRPVVLLTGDVAFLHDVGGLLAAKRHGIRATIVVLDDDGGAIFSYLPIAEHGAAVAFDDLFRTPHGVDLSAAADLAGAHYARVDTAAAFRVALRASFDRDGLSIVAVGIDPDANLAQHRSIDAEVNSRLGLLDFGTDAG